MAAKSTDQGFADTWRRCDGKADEVAKVLGITIRSVYHRRVKVEAKLGVHLPSSGGGNHQGRGDNGATPYNYKPRLSIDGFSGMTVIFSDCHWWPGISDTLAYRALIETIKEYKPKLIIANGDILDGARISRFSPDGWETSPQLRDELEEVKSRMAEIRHSCRSARLVRTVGNHDMRFDKHLAQYAKEYRDIGGFRLKDHLLEWEECTSAWINTKTVVKHRWHGGIHAAWNNVVKSGMTMVTGHTHALEAKPFVDYRGRRYGVQDGTLAEPQTGPQFSYGEDNPNQGGSGFVTITYLQGGHMLPPQLCEVVDGAAHYRDQVIIRSRKRAA